MSGGYPPGCTQWHVDYAAGGYDEPPPEYEEEPIDDDPDRITPLQCAAACRGYSTRADAQEATKLMPHPHNWYAWQMNDGSWHINVLTNRKA